MAASSSSPSPPSHKPLQQHPQQQQQQQQQQLQQQQQSSSSRRIPPPCWSHQETLALIDAYRSKWHSLNRGNLRASHWQEVADAVASSCRHVSPAKTSLQCRHKIEKLRKRYRAEKHRSLAAGPRAGPPSWPYFRKMDSMEIGAASPDNPSSSEEEEDDNNNDNNGRLDPSRASNTRSLQRLLLNGAGQRVGAPSASARVRVEEGRESGGVGNAKKGSLASGFDAVASAVRMVGEGFVRVEKMKMEMAREMERVRMDMELKRTEMFLESQQRIFDAFLDGFRGEKRMKREN